MVVVVLVVADKTMVAVVGGSSCVIEYPRGVHCRVVAGALVAVVQGSVHVVLSYEDGGMW